MSLLSRCCKSLPAFIIFLSIATALQNVPGDLDGNMIVSDDEIARAEADFAKGSITEQNLTEIRHIHDAYPITVTDTQGRNVTIYQPIKTVVCDISHHLETLRTLGVPASTIIGGPENIDIYSIFPEYKKLTCVGSFYEPNVEKIIELHPDLILIHPGTGSGTFGAFLGPLLEQLEGAGLTVACFACSRPEIYTGEVEKLGRLFQHQEEAGRFISFYNGVLKAIDEKVKDLPEKERPLVYSENRPYRASNLDIAPIQEAGGRSLYEGKGDIQEVNPEDVVASNPDVIIRIMGEEDYDRRNADDTGKMEEIRKEIMNRPELQNTTAVKQGSVHLIASPLWTYMPFSGCRHFIGVAYLAKWLHPELFTDLDPKAIHQRYLSEFQGLDYDLNKRGVLVYPPS
ncbi:MAG: corrinoid ABC transporter substrate-binding protein [Methanosaeta sp. PtaU1.Bin112]|nr:MAG: corrinoid ABC transporter substrate-binding protein [Methanosaeta sp. PtaU1.Bin112]